MAKAHCRPIISGSVFSFHVGQEALDSLSLSSVDQCSPLTPLVQSSHGHGYADSCRRPVDLVI